MRRDSRQADGPGDVAAGAEHGGRIELPDQPARHAHGPSVDGTRHGKKLYTIGCAVGDYDNDGHEDLFVTGFGGCILYHNRGDGTFTDVTRAAGIRDTSFATSAAFFDYDRDGSLKPTGRQYQITTKRKQSRAPSN